MGLMTGMMAMTLAGMAINTVGQVKAGRALKRAGEKQQEASESAAKLSDYNASVAQLQADDAIMRGEEEESRFRSLVRGSIGSQRAGYAASSIDVSFGSAVDVQADAAVLGELDALTIKNNAAREAWGFKVQGQNYKMGADIQRKEGKYLAEAGRAGQTASKFGVANTLIGGGASLLQIKYGFK